MFNTVATHLQYAVPYLLLSFVTGKIINLNSWELENARIPSGIQIILYRDSRVVQASAYTFVEMGRDKNGGILTSFSAK